MPGSAPTAVSAMQLIHIGGDSPAARGADRGRQVGATIRDHWPIYLELFAIAGWQPADVERLALESFELLGEWWPDGAAEVAAIADGAELELWISMALAARTELLVANSPAAKECTILATVEPATMAQVWDWHRELSTAWHAQVVTGGRLAHAGVTEHGMCAKVGMNEAGVGVLLAILSHADDRPVGVPIHSVIHRLLTEAATVDEAMAIARSAAVGSSSVLTVVGPTGHGEPDWTTTAIELSPAGNVELAPTDGWLPHTNHFLHPDLAARSRTFRGDPDSTERLDLLWQRIDALGGSPDRAVDLVPMLRTEPGADPANICCVPRPDQPLGRAWQSLATVAIDRTGMTITEGSPRDPNPATLQFSLPWQYPAPRVPTVDLTEY